jgi:hypothetical protein
MRSSLAVFCATALLMAPAAQALATESEAEARIETIHGDAEGFFDLLATLQDTLVEGDPALIAEYGLYPLTINANGETYDVLEEADLIENFESLVTLETQQAVIDQEIDDLIVTQDGVGLGNGALWITNVCLDDSCTETQWGILSINN